MNRLIKWFQRYMSTRLWTFRREDIEEISLSMTNDTIACVDEDKSEFHNIFNSSILTRRGYEWRFCYYDSRCVNYRPKIKAAIVNTLPVQYTFCQIKNPGSNLAPGTKSY